jgi:hypothetical protein
MHSHAHWRRQLTSYYTASTLVARKLAWSSYPIGCGVWCGCQRKSTRVDRSGTDCTSLARRLKTSRSWIAHSQRVTCSMSLVICVVVFICGFVVFMFWNLQWCMVCCRRACVIWGVWRQASALQCPSSMCVWGREWNPMKWAARGPGRLAASVSLAVSVKCVRVGAGMEPHEVGSQRPGWVARARQRLRSAASVMLTWFFSPTRLA